MSARFFGKNPSRRVVRRIPNGVLTHKVETVKENNLKKEEEDMKDKKLERIESIMNTKAPKRKTKVEKKEKGLIERTENSTIFLTEDNKILLND